MKRAVAFALLAALAGCQDDDIIADSARIWTVTALDGQPFAADATLVLLPDGSLTGTAPCNRFSGGWQSGKNTITIGPLASTRRACPNLDLEFAYFRALEAAERAQREGNTLVISGRGHSIELTTED